MKLVAIEWDDAAEDPGGFVTVKEVGRLSARLVSCGILVSADKEAVRIAVDFWEDEGRFRSVHSIPRGMIRKIRGIDAKKLKSLDV